MSELSVIQKCIPNTRHRDGLPVSPHPNVAFVEIQGNCKCDQDQLHPYSTINNLQRQTFEDFRLNDPGEETVKTVLLQLAHAVHHIHENGWIHGCIKLENIYLSESKDKVVLSHIAKCFENAAPGEKIKDITDLRKVFKELLESFPQCTDSSIADDLLGMMMDNAPITSKDILLHPYFWDAERKLNFLSKVTQFSKAGNVGKPTKDALNTKSRDVFDGEWLPVLKIIDKCERAEYNELFKNRSKKQKKFINADVIKNLAENKPQHQLYKYNELQSLLNFIRNRWEHFWEDSLEVQACFGYDHTNGFWKFFSRRFPKLFPVVYAIAKKQSKDWSDSGITDVYLKTITQNRSLLLQDEPTI